MFWWRYWKQFAVALAVIALFSAGYAVGSDHVKNKWQAEKLREAIALEQERQRQDEALAEAEKIATETRDKFRRLYANLKPNDCPAGSGVQSINEAVRLAK